MTGDLAKKRCVPCEGGLAPLSTSKAQQMLAETPGWSLRKDGKAIERRWSFKDFGKSLVFVNRIGGVAEEEGHHPDIAFGWGYVQVTLQTHAIGGLHENDFILAAKINALL